MVRSQSSASGDQFPRTSRRSSGQRRHHHRHEFWISQGSSTVNFGGVSVAVTAWSNTSITAIVPSLPSGASNIDVVVNNVVSNTMLYTVVVPPSIASLSPASGISGNSVTITGGNFGATQGSSTVSFGSATATVTAWSNTSITAIVPPCLAAGTDAVSVSAGGITSNSVNFTVTSGVTCVPAGIPISSVLVGENDWYQLPNNVWPIVGASQLKLVRIGGAGQDSGPLACDNNQGDLIQQILRSAAPALNRSFRSLVKMQAMRVALPQLPRTW